MKAELIKINPKNPEQEIIDRAGKILREGGLVAFPTETVYGLGGDGLNAESSARIYQAKGRPSDNPLIIHIAQMEDLETAARRIPKGAVRLAERFWPGPLTMIFPKTDIVPYETTGGLDSVAVRMPGHPAALALIRAGGGFVAAPSANRSGRPSPTLAAHVAEDLGDTVDMILDGGRAGIGLESTIVDFTEDVPVILRPGYINREMLVSCIGQVNMDPGLQEQNRPPKAPGMRYRHYSPRAPLAIVQGEAGRAAAYINELARMEEQKGGRAGILACRETEHLYQAGLVKSIGSRSLDETIAKHLYQVLREFDQEQVSCIYSESFDTPRMGQAVMNRLKKAAGGRVIQVPDDE
ncbi:MAG: threonylcarbamoyl-AMP synthase [Lachnospiraceae bacterium]|nr:threonylcarbamoyl-AMP synthase [Lachnospiraceae bacterium]